MRKTGCGDDYHGEDMMVHIIWCSFLRELQVEFPNQAKQLHTKKVYNVHLTVLFTDVHKVQLLDIRLGLQGTLETLYSIFFCQWSRWLTKWNIQAGCHPKMFSLRERIVSLPACNDMSFSKQNSTLLCCVPVRHHVIPSVHSKETKPIFVQSQK